MSLLIDGQLDRKLERPGAVLYMRAVPIKMGQEACRRTEISMTSPSWMKFKTHKALAGPLESLKVPVSQ